MNFDLNNVRRWSLALPIACALMLTVAGCDDNNGNEDAGLDGEAPTMDGGDPCAGLTLCTPAGSSCSGDTLTTCAPNADGCLVARTTDCTATGGSCDDSGTTAMCVADPCASIPAAERCDSAGRACDVDALVVCEANTDGCLVETRTDCAASPGGVCDASGTDPMCVLPADPCDSIPAAERCTVEGTSCDTDSLVTCAPNAFGCLVETRDDCTTRSGGACDASGSAAMCTATDPCAGITECTATAPSCDGADLVTCVADAFGCMVETRTTCTDITFGFCDAAATPAPMCSTAAVDPCLGMTLCSPAGRTCDADTLRICSLNAFGCLVETPTDCTASGEVCGDMGGMNVCGDICSFRTTCSASSYCDGGDAVTCTADADGCLVESARTTCTDAVCSVDACVGNCPGVTPTVIDCASGTVSGDTSTGTTAIGAYAPCTSLSSYSGNEQVFVFRNSAGPADVHIVSTRGGGSADFDLFVLDGGDGSAACGAASTCVDGSTGSSATETVDFFAGTGDLYYVVYDLYSSTGTATSAFTLDVTCTPVVCGDGAIGSGETCDDGNTADTDGCSSTCAIETGFVCSGTPSTCHAVVCGDGAMEGAEACDDGRNDDSDGCSSTCTLEPGFVCSGTMPTTCTALAANATCAGATAVTGAASFPTENPRLGGPRPTGTGCGVTGPTNPALYYSVTVPPMTRVDVTTTPGPDIVLLTQDSCADTACTYRTDSSPERTSFTNATASPVTRIVAIHNYSASATATSGIAFAYTGLAANGTCASATAVTGATSFTGVSPSLGGPRPTGTGCGTTGLTNPALYYSVTVPAMTSVDVTTVPGPDIVLLTQDSCADTACTYRTDSAPERVTFSNDTASPFTRVVAIHNYSATATATSDIAFAYVPFACPNGRTEGTETCDDGNSTAGDGCTACAIDSGYSCTGTPSVCTPSAPNGTCATATAVTADVSFAAEQIAGGGAPPAGTGCGFGTGNRALYYLVTIPAFAGVSVQTTPGALDLVLVTQDACSDTACTSQTDSAPERTSLINATGSAVTRVVAVRPYGSGTTSGTFGISFRFVSYIAAACVDTSTATALGVTADDATSSIAAMPFSLSYYGATATHYSVSSNGFMQLWTSSTGTPASAFSNGALPSTSTPNGVVAPFWDDLRPNTGANVYTLTSGAAGSRRFTVEWRNWRASSSGTEDLTFQAQISEATGQIEYHYCAMNAGSSGTLHTGSSATIGAESISGTVGIQISRDTAGAVMTGSGFRFTP